MSYQTTPKRKSTDLKHDTPSFTNPSPSSVAIVIQCHKENGVQSTPDPNRRPVEHVEISPKQTIAAHDAVTLPRESDLDKKPTTSATKMLVPSTVPPSLELQHTHETQNEFALPTPDFDDAFWNDLSPEIYDQLEKGIAINQTTPSNNKSAKSTEGQSEMGSPISTATSNPSPISTPTNNPYKKTKRENGIMTPGEIKMEDLRIMLRRNLWKSQWKTDYWNYLRIMNLLHWIPRRQDPDSKVRQRIKEFLNSPDFMKSKNIIANVHSQRSKDREIVLSLLEQAASLLKEANEKAASDVAPTPTKHSKPASMVALLERQTEELMAIFDANLKRNVQAQEQLHAQKHEKRGHQSELQRDNTIADALNEKKLTLHKQSSKNDEANIVNNSDEIDSIFTQTLQGRRGTYSETHYLCALSKYSHSYLPLCMQGNITTQS